MPSEKSLKMWIFIIIRKGTSGSDGDNFQNLWDIILVFIKTNAGKSLESSD